MMRRLAPWWRSLTRRSEFERGLDDELAFHLEARSADLVAQGLSPTEARRRARIELGMTGLHRDEARRARGLALADTLARDLRYALRGLVRNPGYSLTALLVLGIALAANAMLFTLFSAYALRSPPLAEPDRWVTLEARGERGERLAWWTHEEARSLREAPPAGIEGVYWLREARLTVTAEVTRRASGEAVSSNYFDLLGVRPARGRTFLGEDDEHRPVVLSHLGWQRLLGGVDDPLGRRIELGGVAFSVIGVMPPEFTGTTPLLAMYWLLERDHRTLLPADRSEGLAVEVSGLRHEGASLAAASQALGARVAAFNRERAEGQGIANAAVERRSGYLPASDLRDLMLAALPVVFAFALLLLVAAANLANLVLARFASRQRELAVRVAVGAPRRRLLAQLGVECVLLALVAAAFGTTLAALLLAPAQSALFGLMGEFGFDLIALRIDSGVVAYTIGLSLLATLAFGAVPALLATAPWRRGLARPDMASRHATGGSRLRSALMVGQVAASVVLLVLAGLIGMNARKVDRTDPGFDPARVVVVHAWPPTPALRRELGALPQVESVAGASRPPLMGAPHRADARVGDRSEPLHVRAVDAGYLDLLGVEVVEGRGFSRADGSGTRAAIVSRATAALLWPGGNALGRVLELPPQDGLGAIPHGRFEVVGIAEDVVSTWFISGPDASAVYLPVAADHPALASLVVATRDSTPATLDAISRACVRAAALQDCELMPMLSAVRVQRLPFLAASTVSAALGWIALAISCIGLYGLVAYVIVQKRREIGVRLALGAAQGRVVRELVAVAGRQVALGVAIGLPLAFAASRLAASLSDRLHTFDLVSFAAIPLLLAGLALLAAWLPARRSARIAPTEALRED